MNLDLDNIRSQLAPGWTMVNIVLLVVLFFLAWPLGLLMIAYILGGHSLGVNLGQPETFSVAFGRMANAVRAGVAEFNRPSGGQDNFAATPPEDPTQFEQWRQQEIARLAQERENLVSEQAAFAAEKDQGSRE